MKANHKQFLPICENFLSRNFCNSLQNDIKFLEKVPPIELHKGCNNYYHGAILALFQRPTFMKFDENVNFLPILAFFTP